MCDDERMGAPWNEGRRWIVLRLDIFFEVPSRTPVEGKPLRVVPIQGVVLLMKHAITFCLLALGMATQAWSGAVPVKIVPGQGITRGGQAYFINGAGGEKHLDELMATGGNSIRTWTTNGLSDILDAAQKLGLTVCSGIWLEPECNWFSYANAEQCAKQAARVKKEVMEYRDHPALLFLGLENEAEGDGSNAAYWRQLEVLARMVKEIDPAHPTFTAVAGLSPGKAKGLNEHTPSLDFVGINTYAALPSLWKHLEKVGWNRPWVVTEFGARGFLGKSTRAVRNADRADERREREVDSQTL